MRTSFKIIFILFISIFFLSSCHERGCTDRNAVNYNVTADEDDGSCIICSTTEQPYDHVDVYLTDETWGSPHYEDEVAKFELYQLISKPNNSICGKDVSAINVKVTSLVNQTMYIRYWIHDFSGPVNITIAGETTVGPFATVDEGKHELDETGLYIQIGLDSIQVQQQGSIVYY